MIPFEKYVAHTFVRRKYKTWVFDLKEKSKNRLVKKTSRL